MFRRLLIANRGEVGARILRTCKRMGVHAVAVASEADRSAQWLNDADEVYTIGPARASASYLNADALIEVALHAGCGAVHPGWGFLSENAAFATRCEAAGLTFVGPSPLHLNMMGDKANAREAMQRFGMPVIPGSDGPVASFEEAQQEGERIGYPLLVKAVAGGGGRGMRIARTPSELRDALEEAGAEARACFGDGALYLERLIEGGRHVEVQVIADQYGQCLHLGERECSIQRRHQKVVEEAPSPGLSDVERKRVLPLITGAVQGIGYVNAGTIEMLVDADGKAYFMEMNTRLQVEHPVTEMTVGVDLVEMQLRVAANEPLGLAQSDISAQGHALEFRVNAEDPDNGFRPCPGRVERLQFPDGDGIRIDTHLRSGDSISPHYDSMIAKVIVHGTSREVAISSARSAIRAVSIEGVTTNLSLHERILEWEPFVTGMYDTRSLEQDLMRG